MNKKIKVSDISWHWSKEGEEKGFDYSSLPDEIIVDGFSEKEIEDLNSDDEDRYEKVAIKLLNWIYENYGYGIEYSSMEEYTG